MAQLELVYWKGSGAVHSDLVQAIKKVGYNLTVVNDIEDVASRPERNLPKLIVVDASAGEGEASQRIIEVTAVSQKFKDIPLVFISYHATKRAAVLKKAFVKLVPVDVPFSLEELLKQLLCICPLQGEISSQDQTSSTVCKFQHTDVASQASEATQVADNAISGTVSNKPHLISCDEESLNQGNGGEVFALVERPSQVNDKVLLGEHPNLARIQSALNSMTAKHATAGAHARRVAVLASVISRKMGLLGDRQRSIKIAGLLLNWGLFEINPRLVSYDLLLSKDLAKHEIIANAFLDSARYVRDNIKDDFAADTIEIVSKLVLHSEVEHDDSLLGAQCALVTELTERATWSLNKWSSDGAYRALRKLSDAKIYSVPPKLTTQLSRSLSEASSLRVVTSTLHVAQDENEFKKVYEAKQEAAETFKDKVKASIKVSSLQSGMKLAEPLVSVSGKLLLKANVSLTEEILESLWRTSVMTPVRPEITIAV